MEMDRVNLLDVKIDNLVRCFNKHVNDGSCGTFYAKNCLLYYMWSTSC